MALSEATYRVQFAGGLETKLDPISVSTERMLVLENAVFTRGVSLSKRYGYESLGLTVLGSSAPYSLPRGLAARGAEVITFTEGGAYSHVEDAGWNAIADGAVSVVATERSLVKTVSSQTGCDYAACDGVAVIAWVDSRGGVWWAATLVDGDRVTIAPVQGSATGSRPRCIRCGDRLLVLWAEAALGQIKCVAVDPSAPHSYDTTIFPRVIVTDLSTSLSNFDAAYVNAESDSDANAIAAGCIAWNSPTDIRAAWLDPSGQLGGPGLGWPAAVTIAPGATVCAGPVIAPSAVRSNRWPIAWTTGTKDTHYTILYSDTSSPADPMAALFPAASSSADPNPITRMAIGCRDTGSVITADVWCEEREAVVRNSYVSHSTVSDAGVWANGTPANFRGMCLASCAWTDAPTGGTARGYVNLLHSVPLFSTYVTVRDDGLVVAQSVPGQAGEPPALQLPRVTDTAADRAVQWCAVYRAKLAAEGDNVFAEAGPRLVSLDFDAPNAYQTATAGRTLYLGGAVPQAYDGLGWTEAQPLVAPDWETGASLHTNSTAGSAPSLANGTYSYLFWYEATRANGEIVRGPTSKPYSVTIAGADDRVTFAIPSLRIGAWGRSGGARENCRVCAARSPAGDTSTYYRITSLDPSTEGTENGYVTNSQSADTVAFFDEMADATLTTREPHYTTGGIPSNDPIAASVAIAGGKGRLFVSAADDPDGVYFSQERAEGYGIEFTPELRITVPPGDGPVTALAVVDDALVIFKRGAVYMVAGSGPLPNPAAGGSWSLPALITADVGCVNQRSVATTPVGVVFQSAKGIYLLDRGRNATYIGAPIEGLLGALEVTRATLIEDKNQIRLVTASRAFLFDYLFGAWSAFTNHGAIDAVNAGGLYHYLRSDGRVFRQTTTYADANLQIPMEIQTAWARFGEARQGLQRIWDAQILGTWKSAHTLAVQYQTDYDEPDAWSPEILLDATAMGGSIYGAGEYGAGAYGGSTASRYQWKIHIGRRGQSIRFRFRFLEAAGVFGACAELTELLLTGGVMGNVNKLPAARMG